MEKFDGMGAI